MTSSKSDLRKYFLSKRRSLSREDLRTWSDQICQQLEQHSSFQQAQTVLNYYSFRQEPDLAPLLSLDKTWGLPRCVEKELAWHKYQKGDCLVSGKFGITEPDKDLPLLDVSTIDLILVPAVACTKNGDRLGYGGGFYDRFFTTFTHKVTTIGVVFECCLAEKLPTDTWDFTLDYVCTEKGIYANGKIN